MKEVNKSFFLTQDFSQKIEKIMKYKELTIDQLYNILVNEIGYDISKNNLLSYIQRIPNVNFLIALSKALGVTSDYLLGLDNTDICDSGLNYHYDTPKYKKYHGRYYLYFYPTQKSTASNITTAELYFKRDIGCTVNMQIHTSEGNIKKYEGKLIISDTYNICYISLQAEEFGEIVNMSFCDPAINNTDENFKLAIGLMLSVSSGDLKRVPVVSRFVLSHQEISQQQMSIIEANLRLNTKYIDISPEDLEKSIGIVFQGSEKGRQIKDRIKSAFMLKEYYRVEESFVLNTIEKDYKLSNEESMSLLISMRNNAITNNVNMKINRVLDSHIYNYLNMYNVAKIDSLNES